MKRWFPVIGLLLVLTWCGFATTQADVATERSREAEIAVLKERIRQLEAANDKQDVRLKTNEDNILELTKLVAGQASELSLIVKLVGVSIAATMTQLLAFVFGLLKDRKKE